MVLNEFGEIDNSEWIKSAQLRHNINLDEYTIIPNHIHGITEINNDCRGGSRTAPTNTKLKSLGRIIGVFKTVSTKRINQIHNTPGSKLWQRNYWEHVVRGENDLNRIRKYTCPPVRLPDGPTGAVSRCKPSLSGKIH